MDMINAYNSLGIGTLDHITLIVNDAESTANFYTNILNFKLLGIVPLNAGSGDDDTPDMLNYILQLPGAEQQLCVVTQGLNDQSMFSQYVKKYGPGIHHVGYRCDDVEKAFSDCKKRNIVTASDEIVIDPVFGLKQFFIDRAYSGVFIEIIQRVDETNGLKFTINNMKQLAGTLKKIL